MIERTHPKLSVGTQCRLLSISRSSFYYEPLGETAMNLDLMLLVDKPLAGNGLPCKPCEAVSGHPVLRCPAPSRQIALQSPAGQWMTWHLQNEGHAVNEKRIRRLMRLMRLMRVRRENSPPDCFLTLLTADLPKARHQQACEGAQDLSLSAGRAADRQVQSGLPLAHEDMHCRATGAPTSLASGKWSPGPFPDPPHCPCARAFGMASNRWRLMPHSIWWPSSGR